MQNVAIVADVKLITVLITYADNGKMLFEAGRRRFLAGSEDVRESAEVRGSML